MAENISQPSMSMENSQQESSEQQSLDQSITAGPNVGEQLEVTNVEDGGTSPQENTDDYTESKNEIVNIVTEEEIARKVKVAENIIPDDFFYDLDSLLSLPVKSANSALPNDILNLFHSFGYNCRERCNLQALDKNRLVFSAGGYLQIVNLSTFEYSYIRTTGGGSMGPIAMHPEGQLFAVGEKGRQPPVNIFTVENFRLYRILRGGTTKAYSALCFNSAGNLFASQGGEPDFMLTVWNWKQETVLLRSKAFAQEVGHVSFNKHQPGLLTTAGTGHIKFWKMARTFTGLKLQGAVGRFGKTEISDIEGYVEFADGKVLSGSESGNMLLWEENLIKVQFGRVGGKTCHIGQIFVIRYVEGEILTAGIDGYVRSWSVETIDSAEPAEQSGLVEVEPMNEVLIGPDVQIYYFTKPFDPDAVEQVEEFDGMESNELEQIVTDSNMEGETDDKHLWYVQDGHGAIWKADLSFCNTAMAPKKLLGFHAGCIVACAVSPITYLAVTLGADGTLRLHDFLQKKVLAVKEFQTNGTSLAWIPICVDNKCASIMAGFSDGGIRRVGISTVNKAVLGKDTVFCELRLLQALKPHSLPVTSLAYSRTGEYLATCSEDKTIFFFWVRHDGYSPMCFVPLSDIPRQMKWSQDETTFMRLLIVCDGGHVVDMDSPKLDDVDSTFTLKYEDTKMRHFKFMSIKSRLRHEEEMERLRIEEEKRREAEEEEDMRKIRMGLETPSQQEVRKQRELDLKELEEKDEQKQTEVKQEFKPYIPPKPSPILQAVSFDINAKLWLSMGDYDAGYLYECEFSSKWTNWKSPVAPSEPLRAIPVDSSDDVPITVIRFNSDGACAFIGFQDGRIRLVFLEKDFDLSNQRFHWTISVHDSQCGAVTGIELSHDEGFLLTIGADGNFFVFSLLPLKQLWEEVQERQAKLPPVVGDAEAVKKVVKDLEPGQYTIEQAKQETDRDHMLLDAERHKEERRLIIGLLRKRFKQLVTENKELPQKHRLHRDEFVMDETRSHELQKEAQAKIEDVRHQFAWEVEKARLSFQKLFDHYRKHLQQDRLALLAFLSDHVIYSYRILEEPKEIPVIIPQETEQADQLIKLRSRPLSTAEIADHEGNTLQPVKAVSWSKWEGTNQRILYLLQKLEEKNQKRAKRRLEWKDFLDLKPADDSEDSIAVEAIKHAYETMGYFNLKSGAGYVVPNNYRLTLQAGIRRLNTCNDNLMRIKSTFNQRLWALRDEKAEVVHELQEMQERLREIQECLPPNMRKPIPHCLELQDEEQPENHFKYTKYDILKMKRKLDEAAGRRQSVGMVLLTDSSSVFGGWSTNSSRRPSIAAQIQVPEQKNMWARTNIFKRVMTLFVKPLYSDSEQSKESEEPSKLEQEMIQIEQTRLSYKQDAVLKSIQDRQQRFDIKHRQLRHEKFVIDLLVKMGQLQVNTLLEEKLVLKECESMEYAYQLRIDKCQEQKEEFEYSLKLLKDNVDKKTKELEKCAKQEKILFNDLEQLIGDKNRFRDYLIKVYRKKIKRKTKKENVEGEEEEEEESSSESSEDSDDEVDEEGSNEDETALDLNVCPKGCDNDIYDKVIMLRETRLDNDDLTAEIKKSRDGLLKEIEVNNKKAQAANTTLDKAKQDLMGFQMDKQRRVNALDVLVLLQLHQLYFIRRNELPNDLKEALVFNNCALAHLHERIKELQKEKSQEKKKTLANRKHHVHLIHERKAFQQRLKEKEKECDAAMVAKLGRLADMEILDAIIAIPELEDVKRRLAKCQRECDTEIAELDRKMKKMINKYIDDIREDTQYAMASASLRERHTELGNVLDAQIKSKNVSMSSGPDPRAIKDMEELMDIVQQQQIAIRALNREIAFLSNGANKLRQRFNKMSGK